MANEKIKNIARQKKVRLWEVADELGIQDSALSRKMRKELPQTEADMILEIIERLSQRLEVC